MNSSEIQSKRLEYFIICDWYDFNNNYQIYIMHFCGEFGLISLCFAFIVLLEK